MSTQKKELSSAFIEGGALSIILSRNNPKKTIYEGAHGLIQSRVAMLGISIRV